MGARSRRGRDHSALQFLGSGDCFDARFVYIACKHCMLTTYACNTVKIHNGKGGVCSDPGSACISPLGEAWSILLFKEYFTIYIVFIENDTVFLKNT